MNYQDVAKELSRSPTTIRKWCPRITELSGYKFTFEEVYLSRRKQQLIPKFTKQDLSKFKQLAKILDNTNNLEQAIFTVYGNSKAKREQSYKEEITKEIESIDDWYSEEIDNLKEKINNLVKTVNSQSKRIAKLEEFNSKLENIEIGLRKTKIGEIIYGK